MRNAVCLLFIIFLSSLCGCGGATDAPELAIVEGTVTWQGKPLADAGVAFTPDSGPVAIGQTDDAGHFSLSTHGQPGAAVGTHQVTIQAFKPLPPGVVPNPDNPPTPVSRIPPKYGELAKSGMDANVTPDAAENNFVFDLK